ncbi:MAG: zinc-ribbon domain-containing protein, partial [Parasporobacterium sp.]|nr:zinc-ribbon domain-containing protein [Parasporobacterium sp.]
MKRIKITPENCLASLYPKIAAQWHPEKNGDLTPETVRVETTLRPWWRCEKGHEWQAKTTARAAGLGCPVCQELKTYIRGKNDLQTLCPAIAAEWHPTRNDGLTPVDVRAQSNRKAWWICKNGHEWRATIQGRVVQNSRCPYCAGRKVMQGINDLATLFPDVAAEWDYEANEKGPEEYKPTCPDKV